MLAQLCKIQKLFDDKLAERNIKPQYVGMGLVAFPPMEFKKEDYSSIMCEPHFHAIGAWAREDRDLADVAQELAERVENALRCLSGPLVVHNTRLYLDYKPGVQYPHGCQVLVNIAAYSYNGKRVQWLTSSTDGNGAIEYRAKGISHSLAKFNSFEIKIYPPNILRDVQGKDTGTYFKELWSKFDHDFMEAQAKLSSLSNAALAYDKFQDLMAAKSYDEAAEMLTRELDTAVVNHKNGCFTVNNQLHWTAGELILRKGGFDV